MLEIVLENFNQEKHDAEKVADLIFRTDPDLNPLVFGRKGREVIKQLLTMGDNYFSYPNTSCVISDDRLAGVVVGFPLTEKERLDKSSGKAFMKTMGVATVIRKIPFMLKLNKIVAGDMDEDGYYINQLIVDPDFQGKGLGTEIIKRLALEHGKLYLHVNTENKGAVRFYKNNGFNEKFTGSMKYHGKTYTESLMEKQ